MPTLDNNGNQIFYEDRGKGIPLIFIHPPLLTHFTFQRQLEQLSQVYRVICFDIRGHGKSSATKQTLTYSLIVQDLLYLIDSLGLKKVILCGYSTGGSIVLEAILSATELFIGGVIISGMSEVSDYLLKSQIYLAITLLKMGMMPLLAARLAFTNSDTFDLYWKHLNDCIKGNARNIEEYYSFSLSYNCTDQLKHINTPILLVSGSKDKGFHKYAKILHDKLPHNEMKMILNVDHRIPIKKTVDLHNIIKSWITGMEIKGTIKDKGEFYWSLLSEDEMSRTGKES